MFSLYVASLSDDELMAVYTRAGSEFKALPNTKDEAVAKKVFLAAAAEILVRRLLTVTQVMGYSA